MNSTFPTFRMYLSIDHQDAVVHVPCHTYVLAPVYMTPAMHGLISLLSTNSDLCLN